MDRRAILSWSYTFEWVVQLMAFQQQELPWNEKNDGLSGRQCEGMLGEERSCFDWFGSFVLEFRSMSFVSRRWWLWNCEHMNIKKLLLCFGQNFSCSGFALIASGFFRRKSSYSFRSGYARRGKSSHCCLREFSLALPAACTPPRHATNALRVFESCLSHENIFA